MPYYSKHGSLEYFSDANCSVLPFNDCAICLTRKYPNPTPAQQKAIGIMVDQICGKTLKYIKPTAPGTGGSIYEDEASTTDYTYYIIGAIGLIAIIMMIRSK